MRTAPLLLISVGLVGACVSEQHRRVAPAPLESAGRAYSGERAPIVVGTVSNASPWGRGVFSDNEDRLGGQAKVILKTHLSGTGRFVVLDRDQAEETAREAALSGAAQSLSGASYVISGEVTEFGRRETGDKELFGILGRGKSQLAYSKVSLNVIDVKTSEVVFSVQGAGEYQLDNREVLGFGSTAAYDSTLNGKVLDLALGAAVDRLVGAFERGEWR